MHKTSVYIGILTLVLIGISLPTGVFWDNITFISKAGEWLYNQDLSAWFSLPDDMDSGHPLLPALWCAMIWSIGGKSLLLTHLSLAPFIFITLYFLWRIVELLFSNSGKRALVFTIAIADGTLLSQLILIGPEVFLLAFFMMALCGLLYHQKVFLSIGLALLGLVSLRGMMLCLGLFFTDLLLQKDQWNSKQWIPYLIGAIPASLFLLMRLVYKGWIISNPLHLWGDAFNFDSISDFLRNLCWNIAVLGFRYVDFGRIIIWILLFILIGKNYKQLFCAQNSRILILAFVPISIVIFTSLIIRNPMGHRYFTVSYVFVSLLALSLLESYKQHKFIYYGLLFCLLSGNLIVYPESISQGWDASLAHLPYWHLRKKAIAQMDEQGIDVNQTAAFFPYDGTIDEIELNGDKRSFPSFNKDERREYILYSNVSNLPNETLQILYQQYEPIIRNKFGLVHCDVLRLKSPD